jgi:hypothetical protein
MSQRTIVVRNTSIGASIVSVRVARLPERGEVAPYTQ